MSLPTKFAILANDETKIYFNPRLLTPSEVESKFPQPRSSWDMIKTATPIEWPGDAMVQDKSVLLFEHVQEQYCGDFPTNDDGEFVHVVLSEYQWLDPRVLQDLADATDYFCKNDLLPLPLYVDSMVTEDGDGPHYRYWMIKSLKNETGEYDSVDAVNTFEFILNFAHIPIVVKWRNQLWSGKVEDRLHLMRVFVAASYFSGPYLTELMALMFMEYIYSLFPKLEGEEEDKFFEDSDEYLLKTAKANAEKFLVEVSETFGNPDEVEQFANLFYEARHRGMDGIAKHGLSVPELQALVVTMEARATQ